jgi:flagellar biosynthesis chaperone FliJ
VSLTDEQKHQLNRLIDYRDEISSSLFHIERILKAYFPEEFNKGIQFYIPQITTALYQHEKWLSRGEYSLQNTIDNLMERCKITDKDKGTTKYF